VNTPGLTPLKEKIRHLSQRVITAEGEEFDRLIKELQDSVHQHAEETRRVMLTQQFKRD